MGSELLKERVCPYTNEHCLFFANDGRHARSGSHFVRDHKLLIAEKLPFREDGRETQFHRGSRAPKSY